VSFDGFPASAADAGAWVLERHGARGTFYASAKMAGAAGPYGRSFTPADITRLVRMGHEIGCHSFTHAECARRDSFSHLEDLARNRDALAAMGAPPLRAHAYPHADIPAELKENLPPRLMSARGGAPGLNAGAADLAQLHAYPLFGAPGLACALAALKDGAKRKAWMIAFTHDVAEAPSAQGTTPSDLETLLREAHKLGFIVLPVTAALGRRLSSL